MRSRNRFCVGRITVRVCTVSTESGNQGDAMHSNAAKCRPLLPHDARGWGGPILAADIIPQHQAVAVALPNCEQPAQTPPPDSPQRNDHQPKRAVFPPAAARETCEGVASLEQGSSSTAQQIARMSESGPPAARAGSHLSSIECGSTIFKTPHDHNSRAASQSLRSRWTAWLRHRYHR